MRFLFFSRSRPFLLTYVVILLQLFVNHPIFGSPPDNIDKLPIVDSKMSVAQVQQEHKEIIKQLIEMDGDAARIYTTLLAKRDLLNQEEKTINESLKHHFGKTELLEYDDKALVSFLYKTAPSTIDSAELKLKYHLPGNWGGLREGEAIPYYQIEKDKEAPYIKILYSPVFTEESKIMLEIRQANNLIPRKPIDVLRFEKSLELANNNFAKFFRTDLDILNFSCETLYNRSYTIFKSVMESVMNALGMFWIGEQMLVQSYADYSRESNIDLKREKENRYLNFSHYWFIDTKGSCSDKLAFQAIEVGILNSKIMLKHLLLRGWTPEVLLTALQIPHEKALTIRIDNIFISYNKKKLDKGIFQLLHAQGENALLEGDIEHFYKIVIDKYFVNISNIRKNLNETISNIEKFNFYIPLKAVEKASLPSTDESFLNSVEAIKILSNYIKNSNKEINSNNTNANINYFNNYLKLFFPFIQNIIRNIGSKNSQQPIKSLPVISLEAHSNFFRSINLWGLLTHTYFHIAQGYTEQVMIHAQKGDILNEKVYESFTGIDETQLKLKEFILKLCLEIEEEVKINDRVIRLLTLANGYIHSLPLS